MPCQVQAPIGPDAFTSIPMGDWIGLRNALLATLGREPNSIAPTMPPTAPNGCEIVGAVNVIGPGGGAQFNSTKFFDWVRQVWGELPPDAGQWVVMSQLLASATFSGNVSGEAPIITQIDGVPVEGFTPPGFEGGPDDVIPAEEVGQDPGPFERNREGPTESLQNLIARGDPIPQASDAANNQTGETTRQVTNFLTQEFFGIPLWLLVLLVVAFFRVRK